VETLRYVLTVCSGVLFFVAFLPYIYTTLRGTTVPQKVTWVIWASLDSITLAEMWFEHTLNGQIVGAVLGAWTVVALALLYGKPGWTLQDKLCLLGAVAAVLLWKLSDNATVGIVISNTVVFLGSIMTFKSAWSEPEKEDRIAWAIWWTSCVCEVFPCHHGGWRIQHNRLPFSASRRS